MIKVNIVLTMHESKLQIFIIDMWWLEIEIVWQRGIQVWLYSDYCKSQCDKNTRYCQEAISRAIHIVYITVLFRFIYIYF